MCSHLHGSQRKKWWIQYICVCAALFNHLLHGEHVLLKVMARVLASQLWYLQVLLLYLWATEDLFIHVPSSIIQMLSSTQISMSRKVSSSFHVQLDLLAMAAPTLLVIPRPRRRTRNRFADLDNGTTWSPCIMYICKTVRNARVHTSPCNNQSLPSGLLHGTREDSIHSQQ